MGSWAVDAVLLLVLLVGAVTDVRDGKVYNWLTYPAALAGIGLNAGMPAGLGLGASLLGILVAGGPLFTAYLAGGIGAGDVKLMGVVGAFIGPWAGLYALLYSSLVGGVMAVFLLVWREGFPGLWSVFQRRRMEPETAEPETGEPETGDEDGAEREEPDLEAAYRAPLPRLPFAVAILVGVAWVLVERWMGTTLFEMMR